MEKETKKERDDSRLCFVCLFESFSFSTRKKIHNKMILRETCILWRPGFFKISDHVVMAGGGTSPTLSYYILYSLLYIHTAEVFIYGCNIAWDHDWGKRHCTKYGRRNQVPISIKTNFFFFFWDFYFVFCGGDFLKDYLKMEENLFSYVDL